MTDAELDELEAKAIAAKKAVGCERSLQADSDYIKVSRPWRILELIEDLQQTRKERDWIINNVISNGHCHYPDIYMRRECIFYVCKDCWLKTAKEKTCHQ